MTREDLTALLRRQILIFDGGIGTEIYRKNYFINTSYEQLSLTAPAVVSEIHREYAEAGAEVLTTNTFNANRRKLAQFGLENQVEAINAAGVRLARDAGGADVLIAGAVGPVGVGDFTPESLREAVEVLVEQGEALLKSGADFLIFESLSSDFDARAAAAAARELDRVAGGYAYIPSFATDADAKTSDGAPFGELSAHFRTVPRPAAWGLNCGNGPESTLSATSKIAHGLDLPLVVQPNAGLPRKVDNRTIYLTSPEYFSTYTMRYLQLGARGVGGCCGITPGHIKDMARSVKPMSRASQHRHIMDDPPPSVRLQEPLALPERSKLGAKLAGGEWIRTVEITPPCGFDLTDTVAKAALCRDAGIDAVNLPDGPRASARISPLIAAVEIQEKAGIETVLHLCCRDRSLIALQAELLGCACKRIRNILCITGDPPKLGDYPFSSGVFDVDSIGMTRLASRMNRGADLGGKEIGRTSFVIAVGADPNAIDSEREYRRTCEKVEAGADLIITQPVFAIRPLLEFIDRIEHLHVPLIAGIWPLASYRNAEFMRNEVPGVTVPDEIMLRMARATGREEQRALGVAIAKESIAAIRGRVQGVQVSAPFGNVRTALAVHSL